jgi:large subunit ribosomal protein L22e
VNGRVGRLGDSIKVANDDKKVTVSADTLLSKRYLKYLTKKYLKKHSLREFLYVVAANKNSYQIKYFNIQQEGADQE